MNKCKMILMVFLFSILAIVKAEDVNVDVSPPEPLVNESFFLTFRIKTTGSEEPYISFTPVNAIVQGKREQGVSISTTVINGKFTTSREQDVVYELISERQGETVIKNIKVEIGGKVNQVKDVHINVLSSPKRVADTFMEAQASKTKVYLGEGIDVNYYLYFKTSISANDVKEFPKLNKFIKRFHHVNSPVETVQYKGQVLKRILAYSARLYPEKVGSAVLDPMTISVQIIENDFGNAFGSFGMGSQRVKNKDLASPRIEIEVMPLPSENVPAGFTGLVGEHEFSLNIPKNKYLVNEPIEVKLEVKGKGALENMDAPAIFTDNNLEQFDTKSDVTEISTQSAKKTFEYTYLARAPLGIKARELSLAYFDPNSGRYIEKKIKIPNLEVSGGSFQSNANNSDQAAAEKNKAQASNEEESLISRILGYGHETKKEIDKNTLGIVGPSFRNDSKLTDRWIDIFNILLLVIGITIGAMLFVTKKQNIDKELYSIVHKEIKNMKQHGLNYSDLFKVLSALDKQNKMAVGGVSINSIIEESNLSTDAKNYFKYSILSCEEKNFGINKLENKLNFENKFFKELMKAL